MAASPPRLCAVAIAGIEDGPWPDTLNGPSTASRYQAGRVARQRTARMIDNFALGLTHGLMLLAAWRLLSRPDLQDDDAPAARPSWFAKDEAGDA